MTTDFDTVRLGLVPQERHSWSALERIEASLAKARTAERERCAKAIDSIIDELVALPPHRRGDEMTGHAMDAVQSYLAQAAAAIRSLGDPA